MLKRYAEKEMPLAAKDILTSFVKEEIAPAMKKNGYRKKAFTWTKTGEEVTKVINIQGSSGNLAHDSKYTVNIGIYHPQFHEERVGRVARDTITEADCDLRIRIGHLMGVGDSWWQIKSSEDDYTTLRNLQANLECHAYPLLERVNGLQDMLDEFIGLENWFDAAVAAQLLGLEPNRFVELALESAHENFRSLIRRWATRHGIRA